MYLSWRIRVSGWCYSPVKVKYQPVNNHTVGHKLDLADLPYVMGIFFFTSWVVIILNFLTVGMDGLLTYWHPSV